MSKQSVGMIHALARSGATIICRQIAAMEQVALFSEIHGDGPNLSLKYTHAPLNFNFNIQMQAGLWFQFYSPEESHAIVATAQGPNTPDNIIDVLNRAHDRGLYPVIRDWPHMDFFYFGAEGNSQEFSVYNTLKHQFDLHRAAIIRHPFASYISFMRNMGQMHPEYEGPGGFTLYLQNYQAFLDGLTGEILQYEAYRQNPIAVIEQLTDAIKAPFDPGYAEKALRYTHMTGDEQGTGAKQYSPADKVMQKKLLDLIEGNALYDQLLDKAGYAGQHLPPGYRFT
ncbi:MAG: hypothetical protein AAF213_08710 [Pseudomonadota bacterium]